MRGYFGLVLYQPKFIVNVGSIIRSARCFGCSFICTVGQRYTRTCEDTQNVFEHFPGFHFNELDACLKALPSNAAKIRVEVDGAAQLQDARHQHRAVYFFGGEDRSVPPISGSASIRIPTSHCLNLSVAASIIMYDRLAKLGK